MPNPEQTATSAYLRLLADRLTRGEIQSVGVVAFSYQPSREGKVVLDKEDKHYVESQGAYVSLIAGLEMLKLELINEVAPMHAKPPSGYKPGPKA